MDLQPSDRPTNREIDSNSFFFANNMLKTFSMSNESLTGFLPISCKRQWHSFIQKFTFYLLVSVKKYFRRAGLEEIRKHSNVAYFFRK